MKKKQKKEEYELDEVSEAPLEGTQTDSDTSTSSDDQAGAKSFDDAQDRLEQELEATQAQLARAVADYRNLERRVSEGRNELASWANGELLRKIVPVMDHFDQALRGASEAGESGGWLKGVEMATRELDKTLAESGLEKVQVDTFDPNLHEAVEVVEGEDDKIIKVLEMGYTLNGKVLKPARVVVGRKGV